MPGINHQLVLLAFCYNVNNMERKIDIDAIKRSQSRRLGIRVDNIKIFSEAVRKNDPGREKIRALMKSRNLGKVSQ